MAKRVERKVYPIPLGQPTPTRARVVARMPEQAIKLVEETHVFVDPEPKDPEISGEIAPDEPKPFKLPRRRGQPPRPHNYIMLRQMQAGRPVAPRPGTNPRFPAAVMRQVAARNGTQVLARAQATLARRATMAAITARALAPSATRTPPQTSVRTPAAEILPPLQAPGRSLRTAAMSLRPQMALLPQGPQFLPASNNILQFSRRTPSLSLRQPGNALTGPRITGPSRPAAMAAGRAAGSRGASAGLGGGAGGGGPK